MMSAPPEKQLEDHQTQQLDDGRVDDVLDHNLSGDYFLPLL